MTINDRVRLIRTSQELNKDRKMTLERFGAVFGVGKTAISKIERGENQLTDQLFKAICREFNVNETWLRTGNGPMFKQIPRNEQIDTFIRNILVNEPEGFKVKFVEVLSKLSEAEWELVAKMAKELARADQDPDEEAAKKQREELHAELDRQLDLEKKAGERSEVSTGA